MFNQITLMGRIISLKNNILVFKCSNKTFRVNVKELPQTKMIQGATIALTGILEPRGNTTLNTIKVKKILYIAD